MYEGITATVKVHSYQCEPTVTGQYRYLYINCIQCSSTNLRKNSIMQVYHSTDILSENKNLWPNIKFTMMQVQKNGNIWHTVKTSNKHMPELYIFTELSVFPMPTQHIATCISCRVINYKFTH